MHQKTAFKIMSIIVTIFFFFTLTNPIILGDGGAFIRRSNIEDWLTLPQEKQIGIINFRNGYEKLILVINVKNSSLQGESAVWIFPVPSDPEDVNIDILADIPNLQGSSLKNMADNALNDPYLLMYASQTYVLPLVVLYFYIGGMIASGSGDLRDEYTVYEHIEKMGLTTEKVGAENSEAFQTYLNSNNLSLPEEANTTIDEYIGEDYCFIVSWISDIEEFKKEALLASRYYYQDGYIIDKYTNSIISKAEDFPLTLGVSINFPTEKIYYPLKLTSVYDSETIPIFIQIMDYVTPTEYPDISQDGFINTNYYIDTWYNVPTNLTTFFAEQIEQSGSKSQGASYRIQNLRYTEIEIHSKAKYLTDDLWIDDMAPVETLTLDFVASNGWIVLILIFIFSSCLASLLAGIILFYKQQPCLYKFALLGTCNLTSIIGFFIATFSLKIDQKFVKKPIERKKSESKVPIKWIGIGVLITFLIIILMLVSMFSFSYYSYCWGLANAVAFSLIFVGPIVGTIAMFTYGYYKDKQKTVFSILFSVFFIVIIFVFQIVLQAAL